MAKPVKKNNNIKKRGRPSKYEDISSRLIEIEKLAMHGLTDKEMSDILGIAESTLNKYKLEHPDFSESIKRGKIVADLEVEKSLYKRAVGFEYEEIQQEGQNDGNGGIKIKSVKKTKKYIAPDTAAAFIWLKNRRGWKDKQDIEHSGGVKIIQDDIE